MTYTFIISHNWDRINASEDGNQGLTDSLRIHITTGKQQFEWGLPSQSVGTGGHAIPSGPVDGLNENHEGS